MPLDSSGQFRHNTESAMMHSGGKMPAKQPQMAHKEGESGGDASMTEVHSHGDGTFHTVHDGQEEPHESIGHMHVHLSKIHGGEGDKHFHAHHEGGMMHSHSVESKDGEPRHEEHSPEDSEGASSHLHEAMGGHEQAMEPGQQEEPAAGAQDGGGLY